MGKRLRLDPYLAVEELERRSFSQGSMRKLFHPDPAAELTGAAPRLAGPVAVTRKSATTKVHRLTRR
jgi:hypothetical protein